MSVMRSLLVLVCACGGTGSTPDAGDPDAAADAVVDAVVDGVVDAAPVDVPTMAELPACAIVSEATGVFVEDAAQLVVHDSDGQPICRSTPNVSGSRIAVPPDSAITIVRQSTRGLLTILHPQPGEVIDLVPTVERMYDVRLDFPPLAGATDYRLNCPYANGVGDMPGTVRVPAGCLGTDNLVHGLVLAYNASHVLVGYGKVALAPTDATFVSQGTPVPTPVWQTTTQPLTVTVANAPAGLPTPTVCIGVMVDGVLGTWTAGCPYAGTTMQMPTIGDALVVQTRLRNEEEETWIDARHYPIGTQAITFDAATQPLPRITSTVFGGAITRPSVAWTTSRPIDRGSELLATATWRFGQSPFETSTIWRVVAPVSTPSPILFPQLPLDLQPMGTRQDPELLLWDADGADYSELHTQPFKPQGWPLFFVSRPTASAPTPSSWGLSTRGDYDP